MNSLDELQPITNQITELQTQFYAQNTKSTFFKNTQKLECAASITQSIQINDLFKHTVYRIPNTNQVYFDYTLFKTYGHPEIYDPLVDYILAIFSLCIQEYNCLEFHINLHTFTITAAQRYKELARIFCSKCLGKHTIVYSRLESLHIHNPPKMIDTFTNLLSGLIDDTIRSKVHLHTTTPL